MVEIEMHHPANELEKEDIDCSENTQLFIENSATNNVSLDIPIDDFKRGYSSICLKWRNLHVNKIPRQSRGCHERCRKKDDAFKQETLQILKNVSGIAEPKSLLAIMGASGCGKTTLLNVLSQHNCNGLDVSGSILINNKGIGNRVASLSAYVQQEDLFIGTLTVKEHLLFQAILRMDVRYTRKQKEQRVDEVLAQFGLTKCQDTVIGVPGRIPGISGGEKKRLSFATEIITDPKLLFVDEPTSGLDSYMAESSVLTLQKLSKEGRTIIMTIHQPSSEIFQLFDRFILLAEGRIAFHGTKKEAVEFFDTCGYPCPANYNPADHYIRTIAITPGHEEECKRRSEKICDTYSSSALATTKYFPSNEDKEDVHVNSKSNYNQGFLTQLRMVLWRATKQFAREPLVSKVKLAQAIVIALFIGLIFLQQPNDQSGVTNINGAIFFLIITLSFGNALSIILVFPSELPVFLKENKLNMYRVSAYFLGRQWAELPWDILVVTVKVTIIYWMTGLAKEFSKFMVLLGVAHLTAQCGISYGMTISALAPTQHVAQAIGGPSMLPLFLFGGYFIKAGSIPMFFLWLKVFSWMKYSFEMALVNQWSNFGTIDCANSTAACLSDGEAVLDRIGFRSADFMANLGCILALIVGFRIVAFLILLLKAHRNK